MRVYNKNDYDKIIKPAVFFAMNDGEEVVSMARNYLKNAKILYIQMQLLEGVLMAVREYDSLNKTNYA